MNRLKEQLMERITLKAQPDSEPVSEQQQVPEKAENVESAYIEENATLTEKYENMRSQNVELNDTISKLTQKVDELEKAAQEHIKERDDQLFDLPQPKDMDMMMKQIEKFN